MLAACSAQPQIPAQYAESSALPAIFPDYTNVTVPVNIAPLNFMVDDDTTTQVVAEVTYPGGKITVGDGKEVCFDLEQWHQLLEASQNEALQITLYTAGNSGRWTRHQPFAINVAPHAIDTWLSYRLIEPSYVAYEYLALMQRNLTNFDEEIMVDNRDGMPDHESCLNCHSYQNHRTQQMLYHKRGEGGGTVIVRNGKATLHTDLRREGMMSNPVYPAWHPTDDVVAFSTNRTGQFFHTQDAQKVEVQDAISALAIYDVEADVMYPLPIDSCQLDVFPTWNPEGTMLYYCSAHFESADDNSHQGEEWIKHRQREMADRHTEVRYNLYARPYNAQQHSLGEPALVLNLDSLGLSASLPRISPDGRYLLFAAAPYGCFHIWHKEADIRAFDMQTKQLLPLSELNSMGADSYPSFTDNGRWIVLASRRNDNNYSRVFIAYFDESGKAHKAFELPHKSPNYSKMLLKSYNRPETMVEKANFRP